MKPLLKWAGGKTQILPELISRLPTSIETYVEPFVGGGALLFKLSDYPIKHRIINDSNSELINVYRVIRDNPDRLITLLNTHKFDKDYFYKIRKADRCKNYEMLSNEEKASRFIYLNKTCFNGLYRVNSSGHFNSPFGYYVNPTLYDRDNIYDCSKFMQDVEILSGDFEYTHYHVNNSAFFYLDPPYVPRSESSNFTDYTRDKFKLSAHKRLKLFCDNIHKFGAKFMLSNSDLPFSRSLYSDYKIEEVKARRNINCKSNLRGKIPELIITNY